MMRILNTLKGNKRKVRGISRKVKQMIKEISYYTENFPSDVNNLGYRHLHIPIPQSFIDSKNISTKIKRLLIKTLIDRIDHLYKVRPNSYKDTKIVLLINITRLWDSQIIIFFDKGYYDRFFYRKGPEQKRTLVSNNAILKKWGLSGINLFSVKCYNEEINDEDFKRKSELLFIGEL